MVLPCRCEYSAEWNPLLGRIESCEREVHQKFNPSITNYQFLDYEGQNTTWLLAPC